MKTTSVVAVALALAAALLIPASAQDSTQGGITSLPPFRTDAARAAAAQDAADRKAAPKTLAEIVAKAQKDNYDGLEWKEDEANAGFDAESRAQIRILGADNPRDGMRHFKVVFDPKLGVRDDVFEFRAITQAVRLLHVRGVKRYVVLDYSVGSQYYDVANFSHYVQHVYDPSLAYSQAGSYAASNGQMQDVLDADVMEDALTRFMKVKAGDPMLATLRERIKRNAQDHPFVVSGNAKTLYLGFGETGMTIWPEERKAQ
jgi:hypothetical protein